MKNFVFFVILIVVMYMKFFKNKRNVIKLILFCIMIYLFAYLGTKEYQTDVVDNIRFANEYKDISKNNVFVYLNENKVLEILNGKSGILFMGFPSNIWSHYYAEYLNEVAINNHIEEIYYYDFRKDRNLNNNTYTNIVNKLKEYLTFDDIGNMDLSAPTIVIVKNGEILYFDDEITYIKGEIRPEDYFTDYRKNLVKTNFDLAIKSFKGSE